MELKSLIYTSWASPALRAEDVEAILGAARVNNPLQGLTGLLIFNGTMFMQIIEGVAPAVNELAERLKADRRHSNMSIRDERAIGERSFANWSMAYLLLDQGEFIGEAEVARALARDLPDHVRNLIRGLTHVVREG